MIQKFADIAYRFPKTACAALGSLMAAAMAPTYVYPLLMLGLSGLVLIFNRIERPRQGLLCLFLFGMGFYTLSLYWVTNALLITMSEYWWIMFFSVFGLPLLLSISFIISGYVTVRFTRPGTLSRAILLLTLISASEYARAFLLTGFPWNLYAYAWGFVPELMQVSSLGGAYFVNSLTIFWMAMPALLWIARDRIPVRNGIAAAGIATLILSLVYGAVRLNTHPTQYRDDIGVAIIQPNIDQDEKWAADKVMENFMVHVDLSRFAIEEFAGDNAIRSVALIWPETALDERFLMATPEAPRQLLGLLSGHGYVASLVSGLWRAEESNDPQRPHYFNSIAILSQNAGALRLDDIYDKHHLVPFGEFLPMEQTLGLTPIVGFAGFQWGPGPKVLKSPTLPPVAPMICFEAIFPWYAHSPGADWLVNTSNDGWYGDTPGPYQHLVMTQFRAAEQGKPILRSATTGISAVIDPYGRVTKSLPYYQAGYLVSTMPAIIPRGTFYAKTGESLFFVTLALGLGLFLISRKKGI